MTYIHQVSRKTLPTDVAPYVNEQQLAKKFAMSNLQYAIVSVVFTACTYCPRVAKNDNEGVVVNMQKDMMNDKQQDL